MSGPQMNYVVTSQPMPGGGGGLLVGNINGHRDWQSGLFACFDDMSSCLLTFFFPCCTVASISTRTGDSCCMPFCVPGALLTLRARIRTLGGIQGSVCTDCLTISLCAHCSVCQMKRELDAMGL